MRRVEVLLDRIGTRLPAARLASAAAAVLIGLLLIGFAIAAGTSGVHPEAWAALAAAAAFVLAGLLYAWRLGAY